MSEYRTRERPDSERALRSEEKEYRVVWEMDVSADNPYDAAIQAMRYITKPGTTANVFEVTNRYSGATTNIDLEEWK